MAAAAPSVSPFFAHYPQLEGQYKVLDTNTPSLDKATVICLSEIHTDNSNKAVNALAIASLYRPGDMVLVEGCEGPLNAATHAWMLKEYPSLTKEMEIQGWDCHKALHENQTLTHLETTERTFKILQNKITAENFEELKPEILALAPYLSVLDQEELKKIGPECFELLPPFFQKALHKLQILKLALILGGHLVKRNEAMAQALQKHMQINRRVFVIAGCVHFGPTFPHGYDAALAQVPTIKSAHEVVKKVLSNHLYAVLHPLKKQPSALAMEQTKKD